jgi:hypothetical protein
MIEKSPDKLAEKIALLDEKSIILVVLMSEIGDIFGFYVNEVYRTNFSTDRKKYEMIAAHLSAGFGSALATDKDGMVSETEALAIIRRTTIHYYTKISNPKKPTIVAVWFNRDTTNVIEMSDRIRRYLGLQHSQR